MGDLISILILLIFLILFVGMIIIGYKFSKKQ
ncbi:hypothetical protein LYSBPC_33670 [Lysinibacillus piscis]|uniref:YjcZ family sporulation protein n=1 Tax=Lysinibacillus piscis TaxID=2518931 RepID=A0ABQ5NPG4_9BACI|nr:hypothetical protein LYSBPC_33670 [Lysinibacillus sp. KH24]